MIETKGNIQTNNNKDTRQINEQFNLVLKARNEKLAEVSSEHKALDLRLPHVGKMHRA